MALLRIVCLAAAVAAAACVDEPDACERATERLKRLEVRANGPAAGTLIAGRSLKACRSGGTATLDPVLQCAMQSATDDEAKQCIDAFLGDVLKIQRSDPDDAAPGGFNPLLHR